MRECFKCCEKDEHMIADYVVKDKLVCRKYTKLKKYHVNYEYLITEINDQGLILTDRSCKQSINVPQNVMMANFIHGHCRTCHSLQGSSISGNTYLGLGFTLYLLNINLYTCNKGY